MQIYEVKNDTAEILYSPQENNIFLSDFLYIEDKSFTIVSQVTDIASTANADINIASVKFHLSIDKKNRLNRYNGHTPSKNSEVGLLDSKEIIGLFKPKFNGIVWGNYAKHDDLPVVTDLNFLSSGCAVICDRTEQNVTIVKNMVSSFKKNNTRFLLLDFENKYNRVNAVTSLSYGKDYRIPLDSKALDYILENDINDCPLDAKAVIQGIVLELQKYLETSDENFIPFDTFLNIILAESKESQSAGLMIFANKLVKYRQKKIFANTRNQVSAINNENNSIKLDFADIDEHFYPLILSSVISNIKKKFYVISEITDENITSTILKYIYEKQNIRLVPILRHDCKFLSKISSKCSNSAIFAPVNKQILNESYGCFLNKITNDEFVLCGENTFNIPLVVSLKNVLEQIKKENNKYSTDDDVSFEDLDDLDRANIEAVKELLRAEQVSKLTEPANEEETTNEKTGQEPENKIQESADRQEEFLSIDSEAEAVAPSEEDISEKENDITNDAQTISQIDLTDEITEDSENYESIENSENIENVKKDGNVEVITDNEDTDFSQKTQLQQTSDEIIETNIEEEFDDTSEKQQDKGQDNLDELDFKDSPTESEHSEIIEPQQQIENITEDNQQFSENTEDSKKKSEPSDKTDEKNITQKEIEIKVVQKQEPFKKQPNPNEIPVYEPKEPEINSNSDELAEGDRVTHAQYGIGTVEKLIQYGNKILCSIQFDKVGRRLLDPRITTINKI